VSDLLWTQHNSFKNGDRNKLIAMLSRSPLTSVRTFYISHLFLTLTYFHLVELVAKFGKFQQHCSVSRQLSNRFQQALTYPQYNHAQTSGLDYSIERSLVSLGTKLQVNHTSILRIISKTADLIICHLSNSGTYYRTAVLYSMTNYRTVRTL